MANIERIKAELTRLNNLRDNKRSAWGRGVGEYAEELFQVLEEWADYHNTTEAPIGSELEKALLNGAESWKEHSWGGSSLIYNEDIAERLCTPSELERTKNGTRKPNHFEDWLDVQARALFQAAHRIKVAARMAKEGGIG